MAAITGEIVVILTVTEPERSAAWYTELLDLREAGRYIHPDGRVGQVCLTEPRSGLEICLVGHSGVKESAYGPNAMLTFRDPDNIQLEFFWKAPPAARHR